MSGTEIFELEVQDVYHYRLSYGGQSSYFHGLKSGHMIGSKCAGCGFVWVPPRPICSRCYEPAEPHALSGRGEVLTCILLPQPPEHLRHLGEQTATALIRPDGADTCIKAFVVTDGDCLRRGSRVQARYLPEIRTIADFYFVPEESDN